METTTSDYKSQMASKVPPHMTSAEHGSIGESIHHMKDQTVQAYNSSIEIVRRNPVKSLATALGLGVIVGLVARRRH